MKTPVTGMPRYEVMKSRAMAIARVRHKHAKDAPKHR